MSGCFQLATQISKVNYLMLETAERYAPVRVWVLSVRGGACGVRGHQRMTAICTAPALLRLQRNTVVFLVQANRVSEAWPPITLSASLEEFQYVWRHRIRSGERLFSFDFPASSTSAMARPVSTY